MVILKGQEAPPSEGGPELDEDTVRPEGRLRLVSHFKRERSPAIAKAKMAQCRRMNGKLTCERCGSDPVVQHGTLLAESSRTEGKPGHLTAKFYLNIKSTEFFQFFETEIE